MSPQLHTDFVEVKVHTAKCDSCDKHNKLTMYRCVDCGQHVCSLCWNRKSGDRNHVFRSGVRAAPALNVNHVFGDDEVDGERNNNEKKGRARARGRRVISDDDDDDDVPVLTPAPTTENNEATNANKQHLKWKTVIMNNDQHEDHEGGLPTLWPILPARSLPALRPAAQAVNTNATESTNRATQRRPHAHAEESDPEHPRIMRVYDNQGRQMIPSRYAFVEDEDDDDDTNHQPRRPSHSTIPLQQALRPAPPHPQPATYGPRPRPDVDRQAARNQWAFANSPPTNHQAPRPAQPTTTTQQAPQLAPSSIPPGFYRPRPGVDVDRQAARNQWAFANPPGFHRSPPGVDVDRQAARNQLAFANPRPKNHQAPQPSDPNQQTVRRAPLPAARLSHAQQRAQNAADMAARYAEPFDTSQSAEAYENARQTMVHNRQSSTSHQDAQPAADRDRVAAHNQQAFFSNQRSSSDVSRLEQAREQNAYLLHLLRQQADRPAGGVAQSSVSYPVAADSSPSPAEFLYSQQRAALLASRQAQHRRDIQDRLNGSSGYIPVQEQSPEALEAADALLFYAGAERVPGVPFRSNQDAHGVSQSVNPAGQLGKAKSARSKSGSSSTLVDGSGAHETQPTSARGPAFNPWTSITDADAARARVDRGQARLAVLHSPSGTREPISNLPPSPRGHPSYHHVAPQPDAASARSHVSATQPHGSTIRGVQLQPDSGLPMSDHAATYLNQWNSGRAALSSRSKSIAVNALAAQLDRPLSGVPTPHPRSRLVAQYITASGTEPVEAAAADTHFPISPISVPEGPSGVDVVMGGPDDKIVEDEQSRPREARPLEKDMDGDAGSASTRAAEPISGLHVEGRSEKHQRGETNGDRNKGKEQKASGDVDVVDARKRLGNHNHSEQIDGDGSDIEIVSWAKTDGNKTAGKNWDANSGANDIEPGRTMKKGVAQKKKPESKGQKKKKKTITTNDA